MSYCQINDSALCPFTPGAGDTEDPLELSLLLECFQISLFAGREGFLRAVPVRWRKPGAAVVTGMKKSYDHARSHRPDRPCGAASQVLNPRAPFAARASQVCGAGPGSRRALAVLQPVLLRCWPLARGEEPGPLAPRPPPAQPATPALTRGSRGREGTRGGPGAGAGRVGRGGPAPPVPGSGLGARAAGAWRSERASARGAGVCARPAPLERPPRLPARPWRAAAGSGWAAASWCQVRGLRGRGDGRGPGRALVAAPRTCPGPAARPGDLDPRARRAPARGATADREARLRHPAATAPGRGAGDPLSGPYRHPGSDKRGARRPGPHSVLSPPTSESWPPDSTALWLLSSKAGGSFAVLLQIARPRSDDRPLPAFLSDEQSWLPGHSPGFPPPPRVPPPGVRHLHQTCGRPGSRPRPLGSSYIIPSGGISFRILA